MRVLVLLLISCEGCGSADAEFLKRATRIRQIIMFGSNPLGGMAARSIKKKTLRSSLEEFPAKNSCWQSR